MIKYKIAAITKGENGLKLLERIIFVMYIKSANVMIETCEDALMISTNSFPNAGREFFNACGKIITQKILYRLNPRDTAASV